MAQDKPAPTFGSPKSLGVFVYSLGSSTCQCIKPKRQKGVIGSLRWGGLLSVLRGQLRADVAARLRRSLTTGTAGTGCSWDQYTNKGT